MTRDPRFDIPFEPAQIGPVRARNRFYQVPHCNGMGHLRPAALAAMRGVKADGGWGAVCAEEVEISPRSEIASHFEGWLRDARDAGFDRVDVYAGHDLALAMHFGKGVPTMSRPPHRTAWTAAATPTAPA